MTEGQYLTGQFLIAMPAMDDPNFDRTVTYVCEHNDEGALGIIINRPTDMSFAEIFSQMDLEAGDAAVAEQPVLQGGPVQPERGFVIHADDEREFGATLDVPDGLKVTTSRDILVSLAEGKGPEHVVIALGYAGWGPGQLEEEMAANSWLNVPADPDIVFSVPFERRWEAAASLLGVDITSLSSEAGHG
ncbi:MAG: YqgE/AlgH family protein [Gammaproteobacteria bacterium]|jgi:putative transcriptional regulator